MAGAVDRNTGGNNLVNKILTNIFCTSTAFSFTPGTGGSAWALTLPFNLRLMTVVGTNTGNGTELSNGNGYTTGGSSLGSQAFNTPSGGVMNNKNAVSWSVSGAGWSTVVAAEVWDTAGTPQRYLFGNLSSSITGAVSGDTVSFAASSISYDGSAW